MRGTRWVRLVAGMFAISLVLAACGGDDDGGTGEPTGPDGSTTGENGGGGGGGNEIIIEGFAFQPSTLGVSGPTEVTVTNNDSTTHTFTLDDESVDETVGAGATVTVTLDLSESTGYFCSIHPSMTGTIEVA